MNFVDAVKTCFTKYVGFDGRATRSEYWWWVLFLVAIAVVMELLNLGLIGNLFSLVTLLPSIAVGARRLHDIGKSGWWQLIAFIPLIGAIVLIVFWTQDSQPGDNQYGANPKGAGN